MDMLIDPLTRDYSGQRTTTLANAVYLRLMTPLGTWWVDRELGSRLHELQREKDLPRVHKLAKQYAELALAPIIADGRASKITVTTDNYDRPGWCLLHIEVVDKTSQRQLFKYPVKVI